MRTRQALLVLLVVVLLAAGVWAARAARAHPATTEESFPPLPHHVQAEVFNGGTIAGAAAVGTTLLRHAGLDVVLSANATRELSGKEHNQILVRRGDTTGVGRIIVVLGHADVIMAPDSTHFVDLTVVLGRSFMQPVRQVSASH